MKNKLDEKIKTAEKHGTAHARPSALDGIPKHLPALLRAEKLAKKARQAQLLPAAGGKLKGIARKALAKNLFDMACYAQARGWCAEDLLRAETKRQERQLRKKECQRAEG